MKKMILMLVFCFIVSFMFTACNGNKADKKSEKPTPKVVKVKKKENEKREKKLVVRTLKVNGRIYIDTGRVASAITCGTLDGEIMSSVKRGEEPKKDNESNFGVGYGYQFDGEDTLYVKIAKEWVIFKDIAISSDIIPDTVAHFKAEVLKVFNEKGVLRVKVKSVDRRFKWLKPFRNSDVSKLKPIDVDIVNFNVEKYKVGNIIEIWYDGKVKYTRPETSFPMRIDTVYKINNFAVSSDRKNVVEHHKVKPKPKTTTVFSKSYSVNKPNNEIKSSKNIGNTSIIGVSKCSAAQLKKFLLSKNKKPKISVDIDTFCNYWIEEGKIEGVRGDIAFSQACHETGYFSYGGLVLPEQNNYSGIGATNNSKVGKGAWFDIPQLGVRATIQHLKAYASKEPLKQACIDPRYNLIKKHGEVPYFEDLGGRWAYPGYNKQKYNSLEEAKKNYDSYGHFILKIYDELKKVKVD